MELAEVLPDRQQCAVHVALGSRDPDRAKSGERVVGGGPCRRARRNPRGGRPRRARPAG